MQSGFEEFEEEKKWGAVCFGLTFEFVQIKVK